MCVVFFFSINPSLLLFIYNMSHLYPLCSQMLHVFGMLCFLNGEDGYIYCFLAPHS